MPVDQITQLRLEGDVERWIKPLYAEVLGGDDCPLHRIYTGNEVGYSLDQHKWLYRCELCGEAVPAVIRTYDRFRMGVAIGLGVVTFVSQFYGLLDQTHLKDRFKRERYLHPTANPRASYHSSVFDWSILVVEWCKRTGTPGYPIKRARLLRDTEAYLGDWHRQRQAGEGL